MATMRGDQPLPHTQRLSRLGACSSHRGGTPKPSWLLEHSRARRQHSFCADWTMSRKGRRDCRVMHRKKNHINGRVEKLQKSVHKEGKQKKEDLSPAAASSEPSDLTPLAAAFLSQMRQEVRAEKIPQP